MIPIPHRNTINFLGMQPKSEYLIWREVNGTFTALDKFGRLKSWVIGTGKITKPKITVSNIDVINYTLYQNDHLDHTYTREWQ